MIKVLHVISSLSGCGGVQMLLKNYYEHINKEEIIFDFIVHGEEIGELEKYFKENGSNIFHVTPKNKSLITNLKQINSIIKEGNYDIVHSHQDFMSIFPIYFAKKANVSMRIAQGHTALIEESIKNKLSNRLLRIALKKYATDYWACGIKAGEYLWGNNFLNLSKSRIMNNAVDLERFKFDTNSRDIVRKELNIEGKFVISAIGRFVDVKNHEYIIKIFKEVYAQDSNSILLLVGNGELESKIKELVKELNIEEAVKFLGVRDDIQNILQATDVLLLPSKHEGLPVVLVEAQINGVKCLVSDTITKEIKITELVQYFSINQSPKYWANEVLKCNNSYKRISRVYEVKNRGFDIKEEANKLVNYYKKVVN